MNATEDHRARLTRWTADVERLERRAGVLSLGRLLSFLAILILGGAGISQESTPLLAAGGASIFTFIALVFAHAKVLSEQGLAEAHQAVHQRHLLRLEGRWLELPAAGAVPPTHPYAVDLDLVGAGSLMQRIDVTRTKEGEDTLVSWLGAPASVETIAERQQAVAELAANLDFREALEAYAGRAQGESKLDGSPFLAFTQRKPLVLGSALVPVIHVAPLVVLGLYIASEFGALPPIAWVAALVLQSLLALGMARRAVDAFQLIAARRGYAEAFQKMLVHTEEAKFEAPLLQALRTRMHLTGKAPSAYMGRLDRWAGLAEFHTQFPIHFVVNLATLWDLHVLFRLERWNEDVGNQLSEAFTALAELEALASLATLMHQDPAASLPELGDHDQPLEAKGLAHPLLQPDERVANDVATPRAGSVLIVTGSNMAGKSTLLRAVGLNIALAFAGGPVVASSFRVRPMRLRASMRIDDSLQRGASYFHAELTKLRSVVEAAADEPAVFFLLDELLRGTNARARHLGARAILRHLLDRGASGLAATHDIALSELEDEQPGQVINVHFTDVMKDGEMIFDYELQPGVVKTSNALRLLAMAGIEVDVDDRLSE
ncbi:MAG: DNA mismatch repair protein MutS [Myxococcota bacterium]